MIKSHRIVSRHGTAASPWPPRWSASPSATGYSNGTAGQATDTFGDVRVVVGCVGVAFAVMIMAMVTIGTCVSLHNAGGVRAGVRHLAQRWLVEMRAPGGPHTPEGGPPAEAAAAAGAAQGDEGGGDDLDIEMFPAARPAPTYDAATETWDEAEALPRYSAFAAGKRL